MPDQVTTFTIFVSSPSNLSAERLVIEKLVAELSEELSEERLIALRVFRWDINAIPGVGIDPQAVINSQLKYDIYIGLLGTVFGTLTPRAGSGTEEEFLAAHAKYSAQPETIRVLFYFKNSSENIFQIDPDELKRVHEFRKNLGPLGVLYHDFLDVDQLRESVRTHLRGLILKQWSGGSWLVLSPPKHDRVEAGSLEKFEEIINTLPDLDNTNISLEEEEQTGLLETIIEGIAIGDRFGTHMNRMSELSSSLTATFVETGEGIDKAKQDKSIGVTKDLIDNAAVKMDVYTRAMRDELIVYQEVSKSTLTLLQTLTNLYFEEKTGSKEEIDGLLNTFVGLTEALRGVRGGLQHFRELIERAPSMTMKFRAARKRLSSVLDEYVSSYTVFIGAANLLTTEVRGKLDQPDVALEATS